jgi:hypothetical protein
VALAQSGATTRFSIRRSINVLYAKGEPCTSLPTCPCWRRGIPRDGQFCCLGVLCDLYGKEIGVEWVDPEDGHSFFMEAWAYLPKPVMEWAGLSEPDPKIGGP